jgi:hypothetical protein
MPFNNMQNQCTALSKRTGERCRNPAVTGYTVCFHHGANPGNPGGREKGCDNSRSRSGGAPSGNVNGLKHGAYSARLPEEQRDRYEELSRSYTQVFDSTNAIDRDCIHRLALFQVKLELAIENGAPGDALEALQRMIHRELKALRATRESKDTNRSTGTTPAEVMGALLARVRERGLLPPPPAVEAEIIDAEVVEVE